MSHLRCFAKVLGPCRYLQTISSRQMDEAALAIHQ